MRSAAATVLAGLARLARARQSIPLSARRGLLVLAAIAFIIGLVISFIQVRALQVELDLIALLPVALVGVPLTIALNAAEYNQICRAVGIHVGPADALRIAIVGAAVNLTPLPGAALVRFGDLKARSVRSLDASLAVGLGGLFSLSMAGAIVGVAVEVPPLGRLAGGIVGIAAGVASFVLVRKLAFRPWRFLTIEAGLIIVTAFRLVFVLRALGFEASLSGALLMASVYAVVAAIGVLPGGLGLREGLAGYLGSTTGLAASAGFMASAVDRLLGLVVHVPLTLAIARHRGERPFALANRDV